MCFNSLTECKRILYSRYDFSVFSHTKFKENQKIFPSPFFYSSFKFFKNLIWKKKWKLKLFNMWPRRKTRIVLVEIKVLFNKPSSNFLCIFYAYIFTMYHVSCKVSMFYYLKKIKKIAEKFDFTIVDFWNLFLKNQIIGFNTWLFCYKSAKLVLFFYIVYWQNTGCSHS